MKRIDVIAVVALLTGALSSWGPTELGAQQ